MTGPVPPSSPIKSSIGTIPPDTSTYSPSADIGTTTEVFSFLKKKCCVSADLQNVVACSQGRIRKIRKSSRVWVVCPNKLMNNTLLLILVEQKRGKKLVLCLYLSFVCIVSL